MSHILLSSAILQPSFIIIIIWGYYDYLITHFLSPIPYYCRASLLSTLEKRLGRETILEQLHQIYKSEWFIASSKEPEPHYDCASDFVFDYTFTVLFKRLECTFSTHGFVYIYMCVCARFPHSICHCCGSTN